MGIEVILTRSKFYHINYMLLMEICIWVRKEKEEGGREQEADEQKEKRKRSGGRE